MNTALILHLLGVGVLYLAFGLGLFGLVNFIKPIARLNIRNRRTAAKICGIAILLLIVAVLLPAPIIQSSGHTKLDDFMSTFQYFESQMPAGPRFLRKYHSTLAVRL